MLSNTISRPGHRRHFPVEQAQRQRQRQQIQNRPNVERRQQGVPADEQEDLG